MASQNALYMVPGDLNDPNRVANIVNQYGDAVSRFDAKTVVNVNEPPFNAKGNGITDDTAAIQSAINSLPTNGGVVYFPSPFYAISSSLITGNGSTAAQSTTAGIYLIGRGGLQGGGTTLKWIGGATSAAMLVFLGPMKGWGVKNLIFDCNSLAGTGMKLVAASNGQAEHCAIVNATSQLLVLISLTSAATGNANTQFNTFNDIQFFLSNVANTIGILLDGNGSTSATNTSLNTFNNCGFVFPNVNTAMFGLYCRDTDGNYFSNLIMFGGGSGTAAITFDYTGAGAGIWPSNNTFMMFDPDGLTGTATKYLNSGAPAASARPNRFYGILDGNGSLYPKISNAAYTPELVNPGVDVFAQTASIGVTNLTPVVLYVSGLYRLSFVFVVSTPGTGGTVSFNLTWTDEAGSHTATAVAVTNLNAANQNGLEFPIRALSGTNIQWSTTVTGATGSPKYDFHIKVEKLD